MIFGYTQIVLKLASIYKTYKSDTGTMNATVKMGKQRLLMRVVLHVLNGWLHMVYE